MDESLPKLIKFVRERISFFGQIKLNDKVDMMNIKQKKIKK